MPLVIVLILLGSCLFFLFHCKKKESDPTYGFIKRQDGTVVYRSAFLRLITIQENPITEADYATFTILNRHYAKDKALAYYHQYFFTADVASFEALDDNYGKDKNRVYFENRVLPEADPATIDFLPREGYLLTDGKQVFYRNDLLSRDAKNFVKIGTFSGAYKSTDVVMVGYNVLEDADPASFGLADSTISQSHFRDKRYAYFNGMRIEKADIKSFRPLNSNFATDKNHVYCYDRRLEGADRASFELIDESHGKDKFRTYSTDDPAPESTDQ